MFVDSGTILFLAAWQSGKCCSKEKIHSVDQKIDAYSGLQAWSPKKRAPPSHLTSSNWNSQLCLQTSICPKSIAGWGDDLRDICQGSPHVLYLFRSFLRYIGLPRPIREIHGFSYPFIESWDDAWPVVPMNSTRVSVTHYSNGLSRSKGTKVYTAVRLLGETIFSGDRCTI